MGFTSVTIQYRLGAFGFLSSWADVAKYGSNNVGLLDHASCFEWVQEHISQFGGDPLLVTIGGVVSTSGPGGTFAFLPVIDGHFIRELPSKQLLEKKNNANDGIPLSLPYQLETTADFRDLREGHISTLQCLRLESFVGDLWVRIVFLNDSFGALTTLFGDRGPTAVNQSEFATGYQQTVFNIFVETSFDCPSYWLADAFSRSNGKESWKYQYSVTRHITERI
ncbi:CAZyme family CE10 [Penicillium frequentans]|nr:CAZyme family CE10 [Penicillium glabrum]